MKEYVYDNPQFKSYVNDFGDEYHEPEDERESWVGKDVISQLKQIKRRYRDFGEYCDAMNLINRYIDELIYRYGGKKRFKLMLQLELVNEYLPIIPILKRTKLNRQYIEGNAVREYTDKFDATEAIAKIVPTKNFEDLKISFGFSSKGFEALIDKMRIASNDSTLSSRYVTAEIDAIEEFYKKRLKLSNKDAKKKAKKKILKRKMAKTESYTMDDMVEDYYWRKDNRIDDSYDPNEVINYKGTTYRRSEAEELETAEFLKELGIDLGMRQLSKKTRKVVKRKKQKEKKKVKKSKKEKKIRKSYMKSLSDGKYETFNSFKKEVGTWVSRGKL